MNATPAPAITLSDKCTGADLVAAIAEHARRIKSPKRWLLLQLTSDPRKWEEQTRIALRPKAKTIARVRALIEGEPVPPAPPNNFQRAELPARRTEPRRDRIHEPRPMPDGDDELRRRRADCARGSDSLRRALLAAATEEHSRPADIRAACAAEATSRAARLSEAQRLTTNNPLPAPEIAAISAQIPHEIDDRPVSYTREPCSWCGTRGDLGCRHQRPSGPPDELTA